MKNAKGLFLILLAMITATSCKTTERQPVDIGCRPSVQVDERVAASKLIVLTEFMGTNELPQFVANLACTMLFGGKRVIVGLEIPTQEQAAINEFLASAGGYADREKLLGSRFFSRALRDGTNSQAKVELINTIRQIRQASLPIDILAFDFVLSVAEAARVDATDGKRFGETRDDEMVKIIEMSISKNPDSTLILLATIPHASKENYNKLPGFRSMSRMLDDKHNVLAFSSEHLGGTWWHFSCGVAPCQSRASPEGKEAGPAYIRLYKETEANRRSGFDGTYFIGSRTTASPPAVPEKPRS